MRVLLTTIALGAALALSALNGASAQKSGTYCLVGSGSGEMNCAFATMAQCQAAMTGTITERCILNPNADVPAPSPR